MKINMYKRKIVSKYNFIRQEIENTNAILEKARLEVEEKVAMFLKGDDDSLAAHFTEIDQDLEVFHNKLCLVQDALEDGKLNTCIEDDIACNMISKKEISANIQNGTSGSLRTGGNLEQGELVSSSSSQNDEIRYGKNVFSRHIESQPDSRSEKITTAKLGAFVTEPNIVTAAHCNEPHLPSISLASSISGLQNDIKINTDHSVKEINTERSKLPQKGKSDTIIEHVSSSDGSSVYGTVSSEGSGVLTVDMSETVVSENSAKQALDGTSLFKESRDYWHPAKSPGTSKWNSVQDSAMRTHSIEHSSKVNIPYPDLKIGSHITATVQDITNPSDFWIQIDNIYTKRLCPITNAESYDQLLNIRKDIYCLAPLEQPGEYFRAIILEVNEKIPGKQRAEVFYLDLGCKGSLDPSTLKVMPVAFQRIPSVAIHCALQGVVPVNGKWSYKAIKDFKNTIEVSDIKIIICSRLNDTYFVQVSITANIPGNGMFTYDMADMLCEFNFAVRERNAADIQCHAGLSPESSAHVSSNSTTMLPSSSSSSNNISMNNGASFMPAKNGSPSNDTPHDHKMNYNLQQDGLHNKESNQKSVISRFGVQNAQMNVNNISNYQRDIEKNLCKDAGSTSNDDFDWNVNIPFPSQKFEKKAKFVVMLSAIVSPSDFYVNLAMPNSTELDDLQEHMLSVYQNLDTSSMALPPVDKLCGMFCCCQFAEDKNWYRVHILELCNPTENVQNSTLRVRVQYVDYGNETEVNINELIPLKKEFATHPAFSFHCSLAGIRPRLPEHSCDNGEGSKWNIEAISRFKCLTGFEKCYTAEIADTVIYDERKTLLPIYLWDTVSAKDVLINAILVEQGAADGSDLELLYSPAEEDIDNWDPMAIDYHSTLNSYGVNMNDPEVATVGYNSTIDKQPVEFLGENIPLPAVNSTVFVLVSAMIDPGYFFVVFPFGTKSVELLQSEIHRCTHKEEDVITEFMENMNKYYNRSLHRKENSALALACGDLVAVKWKKDGRWYRGRVCDVYDTTAPVLTHFLDFGNCEVIERTNVHDLELQFRHFPFQAVECHLQNIEPKCSEGGQKWSDESKIKFQEITENKILVACIKNIYSSSLYVELFTCSKDQEFSINQYLVHCGYGQLVQVTCNNSMSSHSSQNNRQNKNIFIPA